MARSFHFISGLPRSGSTLLGAVLRQNPRFHAAMTSPVAAISLSLLPEMSPPSQFASFFDDAKRRSMLRALFATYYDLPPERQVVFDTNRIWTGKMALLADLFPASHVICCVREIGWIIDSVERMLRRNPLHVSRIFEGRDVQTIYARVDALMNPDTGFVGAPWGNLREAWFGPLAGRLLLVSYEGFVNDPGGAMHRLYQALGEPFFAHDFADVAYEAPDYDAMLGMPGLHSVARTIGKPNQTPGIPPDIFKSYANSSFWNNAADRIPPANRIC